VLGFHCLPSNLGKFGSGFGGNDNNSFPEKNGYFL